MHLLISNIWFHPMRAACWIDEREIADNTTEKNLLYAKISIINNSKPLVLLIFNN